MVNFAEKMDNIKESILKYVPAKYILWKALLISEK